MNLPLIQCSIIASIFLLRLSRLWVWFVVILSKNTFNSVYVFFNVGAAWDSGIDFRGAVAIPTRLEEPEAGAGRAEGVEGRAGARIDSKQLNNVIAKQKDMLWSLPAEVIQC